MKRIITVMIAVLFAGLLVAAYFALQARPQLPGSTSGQTALQGLDSEDEGGMGDSPHPLSVAALRADSFPGSEIVIEQELNDGVNYKRYLSSYKSEGLKIYALLTVPKAKAPEGGYPAIIFNHGYIPPAEYKTTEKYVAYTNAFSSNGYVLFRPDYRGHGNSEGEAVGGYGSNAYTIDVLNALSSVALLDYVNAEKIGMWGHSMGGHITLRSMVVDERIKAGVIWAGVVGSYEDLLYNWRRSTPPPSLSSSARRWRQALIDQYGEPSVNPAFWNSLSSTSYLSDISGPVQIHHGTNDTSVPVLFSEKLDSRLKEAGKDSEIFIYNGDDHNLSRNLSLALRRSVEFFDSVLK